MKAIKAIIATAIIPMAMSCTNYSGKQVEVTAVRDNNVIVNVPRGEQAPPANPGQRNFGGMMPMGGANRPRAQRPQGQGQAA